MGTLANHQAYLEGHYNLYVEPLTHGYEIVKSNQNCPNDNKLYKLMKSLVQQMANNAKS